LARKTFLRKPNRGKEIISIKPRPRSVYDFLGLGYWHQRADERHGNCPQGNQELLVVRDKTEDPR